MALSYLEVRASGNPGAVQFDPAFILQKTSHLFIEHFLVDALP